ncbi:MAG: DNA-directed RNA polymerase subunit omega [Candidatus Marinimicrobia bacterium]|nr:DNA-directed RNA polymerase subunit omega [Candidatus Neomarinimicrobiota bacterium]MCF7839171.1 DNA-directed RNA polymerase subunit omega [Candidatus Neomarinimicrobiota bacterium]
MALKTIPFRELEKHTPDMFEAVTVVAKRARQIRADRFIIREEKRREEESMEEISGTDELEERDPDFELKKLEFDKVDKPVTQALKELLEENLEWSSAEDEPETEEE